MFFLLRSAYLRCFPLGASLKWTAVFSPVVYLVYQSSPVGFPKVEKFTTSFFTITHSFVLRITFPRRFCPPWRHTLSLTALLNSPPYPLMTHPPLLSFLSLAKHDSPYTPFSTRSSSGPHTRVAFLYLQPLCLTFQHDFISVCHTTSPTPLTLESLFSV